MMTLPIAIRRSTHTALFLALALTGACSSNAPAGGASPASGEQAAAPAAAQKPASAEPAVGTSGSSKETRTGLASFMSDRLEGRKTASGEVYDKSLLVAAHPTYAMGTVVRVTSKENGRSVEVTIVDRSAKGNGRRIIDLSRAAAQRLDFIEDGTVEVTTDVLKWGPRSESKQ